MPRILLKNGRRIRVLVVDDSSVSRRLVTQALSGDDVLEVVGSAANGAIAVQRILQLNPDVITLDLEMAEMDGLETLKRVRQKFPTLVVILLSTLTTGGAASAMDALALGANDCVTKVSIAGALDRSLAALRQDLVPKIKQLFDLFEGNGLQARRAKAVLNNVSKIVWRAYRVGRKDDP